MPREAPDPPNQLLPTSEEQFLKRSNRQLMLSRNWVDSPAAPRDLSHQLVVTGGLVSERERRHQEL